MLHYIVGEKSMKILLVIDQFNDSNNGTTISARRFAEGLEKRGHKVSVLSVGKSTENNYGLKEIPLPVGISHIVKSQGMAFAMPDSKVFEKALQDVDIVHFYLPFVLSRKVLKKVEELNISRTAAFHMQPENVTYTIKLGTSHLANDSIYTFYRNIFYNRFNHIHCPSNFIAEQLKNHGYSAKMHVISNGVDSCFQYIKTEKPEELKDKFVITMIGRYSNEKRQDVLIDAISKSKYSNKIQLVLAGKGPKEKSYEKLGKELKNPPIMKFYKQEELINLLGFTDLYVHSADAEIEAISCIEAFACGNVPIIANSSNSATPQFSLHENSLFVPGNSQDLANKIDFWIENPELKEKMEVEYSKSAENYRLESSICKIERMFEDEISERRKSFN